MWKKEIIHRIKIIAYLPEQLLFHTRSQENHKSNRGEQNKGFIISSNCKFLILLKFGSTHKHMVSIHFMQCYMIDVILQFKKKGLCVLSKDLFIKRSVEGGNKT